MHEYNYKPNPSERIIMTEVDLREYSNNNKNKPPDSRTEIRNLTFYIKLVVQKTFEQMLNYITKIPFAIRAMLKMLVMRARGIEDFS